MSAALGHVPVLAREVVQAFSPVAESRRPERPLIVDGTLGLGGHSERLLEHYPRVRIFGLEWDREALSKARERLARFGDRFQAQEGSYAELPAFLAQTGVRRVEGV